MPQAPATVTIEEATECLIDYRGKTPTKTESGVRLITAKVIKNGRILDEPKEFIATGYYDQWMRRGLPQSGDVLLTTEAPLGEVALLRNDDKIALAQRVILLRARRSIVDPTYLFYALQSKYAQGELMARSSGTTVLGVKQSELRRCRIPLVPLPDQRRIASILSVYDELIETNLQRIRILEGMARAVYREWLVEFRLPGRKGVASKFSDVASIPKGWQVKMLGEVAEDVRRNVPKGDLEGDTPYVGLEHIPRGSLALDAWEMVRSLASNKLKFEKGEILFGKIRPYFHKVCIAPFAGVCSADTIVIRAVRPENYAFVVACVSSEEFVAHATATSNGAKMPRANWDILKKYKIVIPSGEAASRFSALFANVLAEQQNLVFQSVNLRQTRDLLLPRLLSGKQVSVEAAA